MAKKKALILVDLQNDFCAGGNLAVPRGDDIIPLANKLQSYFDIVIATKDWHPDEHMSFAKNHTGYAVGDVLIEKGVAQVLWPHHCVQESAGAEFHPKLNTAIIHKVFYKGIDKNIDSYSAFFDNAHLRATGLGDYLKEQAVEEVYIMGLATDYCVKYSTLDALHLGFKVTVIEDGCRGVELNAGDVDRALSEMRALGAEISTSENVIQQLQHEKKITNKQQSEKSQF